MAVKPISQAFADELTELVKKYSDSGLTNSECVGTLDMFKFQLQYKIQKKSDPGEKPY